MRKSLTSLLLASALMAICASPLAVFDPANDDTDLFRNNPSVPSERPNVLIILDNSANWSVGLTSGGPSKFDVEKYALKALLNGDATATPPITGMDESFNLGLMIMTQGGNCADSGSTNGGYVRFGIRQMNTTNKAALTSVVNGFTDASCGGGGAGDQGSAVAAGQAMYEAYAYFAGKKSRSGIFQVKRDFNGNTHALAAQIKTLPGNPFPDSSTDVYASAQTVDCQKNYVIFISNGPMDNSDDGPSGCLLVGGTGCSGTPLLPGGLPITNPTDSSWLDEFADYLANTGFTRVSGLQTTNPKIYTYTVEVDPKTNTQGAALTALLKSAATHGKGTYFPASSADGGAAIVAALQAIFKEIQAVNSVFASSTLPVSVNVRGTNLNQLYIGVFRPDAADAPRWLGNLKAYKLGQDVNGNVFTVDANGVAVIDGDTGFVKASVTSFWTKNNLPNTTYWGFRSSDQNGDGGASDLPDGDLVEKGGAAQQLRSRYFTNGVNGSPTRPVYTCTRGPLFAGVCAAGTLLSVTPFTSANSDIDQNSLNITSRTISSLSAAVTKSVSALADTRPVILDNLDTTTIKSVSSIVNPNAGTPVTISALSNTRTVNITQMTNGASTKSVALTKVGSGPSAKAQGVVSGGHGLQATSYVMISGGNAAFNTTVPTAITLGADANTFSYALGSGNSSDSTGTLITSLGQTTVTAAGHGFGPGQSVTITGVTPTSPFQDSPVISSLAADVTTDTFKYATAVSTGPVISGAQVTGASTTVTATAAGHTLLPGQVVTISGASQSGFNITATVLTTVPGVSFTYQTPTVITTAPTCPALPTGCKANFGGTIATVNSTAHGFNAAQTITISGVTPAAFNGSYGPLTTPIFNITPDTFDITVPAGLGAPTGTAIKASPGTGATVTATLANHGFSTTSPNDSITIAGADATSGHNGNWTILTVPDANTFTYTTTTALPAPGGNPTVRLTSNPLAYATITGHGYGSAGAAVSVTISGASPNNTNGYNQAPASATVVDANTISYVLSAGAQGTATGSITAQTNGTTATAVSVQHSFANNSTVTIAGATDAAFNGTHVITKVSDDVFTYTVAAAGVAVGSPTITAAGQSERTDLIDWVRGMDVDDENNNQSTAVTGRTALGLPPDPRPSIHGDVLHSRPAVVNYNRRTDTGNTDNDLYIFYGGNDGLFRAIKGGFGSSAGDPAVGTEVWAFVAPEHFGNLRRLRLNAPAISSGYKKPYFFDGPISVYTSDNNSLKAAPDNVPDGKIVAADGDKVWLYLSMRRGGRFIYALDASDPLAPKMLWRKGCPSAETDLALKEANGCDLGFGELGYTFSEPKITTLHPSITTDPVLIFGAGYDPLVEDQSPASITCSTGTTTGEVRTGGTFGDCTTGSQFLRSMGRGLFVVNAATGALIFRASGQGGTAPSGAVFKQITDMNYSVSMDIALVLGDTAPRPFRAYFGDNGGQMWRFDFGDADRSKWSVVKLASIADQTTFAGRRKFQQTPDVVGSAGYDMVIAGTGDREHPFDESVVNRVYAFKDRKQAASPVDSSGNQLQAVITHADDFTYNSAPNVKKLLDVSTNCIQVAANCNGTAPETPAGTAAASQNTAGALSSASNEGWFISLASGEKQIGSTLAAGSGSVLFATNQPSTVAGLDKCRPNLGIARQYAVNFENGTAFTGTQTFREYNGGGFLPSPVLVFVGLGTTDASASTGVPVGGNVSGDTIGVGAGSSLGGGNDPTGVVCYGASCALAPGRQLYSRLRKFWYKEID